MKSKLLIAAVCLLAVATSTQARPGYSLMNQACAMNELSDAIGGAHRRSLWGHPIQGDNQRFLEVVHSLQAASDTFLVQVRSGADAGRLSYTLTCIRRSMNYVHAQATRTRLAPDTRALMCRFDDVLPR